MVVPLQSQMQKLPVIEVEALHLGRDLLSLTPISSASPSPIPSPQIHRKNIRQATSVTSLDPNSLCEPIASSTSSTPKSTPSKSVRFSFTSPTIIPIEYDHPSNRGSIRVASCKKPNNRCAKICSILFLCLTFFAFVGVLSFHFTATR